MIHSNGVTVCAKKCSVTKDGRLIPFAKGMKGNHVTITDERVYVDGFELKGDKWKRTFRAFWQLIF